MTASHLQILPPGPIKLIGLPPTATMGVTNARVLHRRLINNNNNITNNLSSISNNTSSLSLGSAKRCLFGSPDPGVIKHLYEEDLKRNRERFIQRYNYDIIDEKFVNDNNNTTTTVNNKIIDEDCENRLHGQTTTANQYNNDDEDDNDDDDEVNENKSDDDFTSSPSSSDDDTAADDKCNLDNNSKKNPASLLLLSSSPLKDKKLNERLKPYSRQAMMTEFYANRKTTAALTVTTTPTTTTTAIVGSSTIPVSSPSITNTVSVSQLPKPQKAQLFDQQSQTPSPQPSVGQNDEEA